VTLQVGSMDESCQNTELLEIEAHKRDEDPKLLEQTDVLCIPDAASVDIRRRQYTETVVIYLGFLILGLSYGIEGPSLLDLQIAVNTDTATITRVFIGRSLGTLLGSILSGLFLMKADRYVLVGTSCALMGVLCIILPWTVYTSVLSIVLAGKATAGGFLDAAGNLCLLMVWDSDNGPWMQALHLIFAVGASLGPVLDEPFMNKKYANSNSTQLLDGVCNSTSVYNQGNYTGTIGLSYPKTTDPCVSTFLSHQTTNIWSAYLISGVLSIIVSVLFLMLYLTKPNGNSNKRQNDEISSEKNNKRNIMRITLLVFVLLFYICHCTVEIAYQSFIFAYAVENLLWDKESAAMLNTALLISFTFGRGFGILLIKFIRPHILMIIDAICLILSVAPLIFFAHHTSALWICSVCKGWSISRFFATGVTWLDTHIKIEGVVSAIFMIAGATGDMIGPVVLTSLYSVYGLGSFPYLILVMSCLVLFTCVCMIIVAHNLQPKVLLDEK